MEQSKKYSEMTFEEFIAEVLNFKLNEQQLHLVKMFEETKGKKECSSVNLLIFRGGGTTGDINTLLKGTTMSNNQGIERKNGDIMY